METILNLAWVLLAIALVRMWTRHAPREGASRGTQMAAVAMLVLILFPVISVSDDLQAAQNPAEDDVSLRREHTAVHPHFFPVVAAVPPAGIAGLSYGSQLLAAPVLPAVPTVDNPAMAAIQNRPPPAA